VERDAPREPQFESRPRHVPPTKELFRIIPTLMMNRVIILGRRKVVRRRPVLSVTVADNLSSSVKVVSCAGVTEAKGLAGLWSGAVS